MLGDKPRRYIWIETALGMAHSPGMPHGHIFGCLVDGCSVRATGRITGATKNTIQKLTRDLGQACLEFQDNALRNLTCQRIQADEIWNFCYAKEKNLPDRMRGQPGIGSMWTWTAMCGDTKVHCKLAAWRSRSERRPRLHAGRFWAAGPSGTIDDRRP